MTSDSVPGWDNLVSLGRGGFRAHAYPVSSATVGNMGRPDFLRTILEFQARFPDERACWEYLVECRWPDGYRCPRCGCVSAALLSGRRLWQCSACRYQASVNAGTGVHR